MTPTELAMALHATFDYSGDNNPDLVGDPTFPMSEVTEELFVRWASHFLIAYIHRNEEMIARNLQD